MKLFEPVLFRDGQAVSAMRLSGAADVGRVVAGHAGHFALHEACPGGEHLLVRDLLGVHKLFFALGGARGVEAANYLVQLLRAGHPVESVFSVPAGHYVRVRPGEQGYELVRWSSLRFGPGRGGAARELPELALSLRAVLDDTLRMLARRFAGRPVYVTLSGGLDSTTIAALASDCFEGLRAVTFALRIPREAAPGADLFFARRAAADLGLEHVEVLAEPAQVLELLDDVLVYGQDYRDFNVHCGLVNAALARAIAALHPRGPRPVVLTGDTMNELLADYAPIPLEGHEYCGLPALDRGRLRRFLVGGLDSGDREVGIFARFGVETVQPYALCAAHYAALPADVACGEKAKARLVRAVMGDRIPEYVLARPKVRAQVAVEGEPSGTLALLKKHGIDQAALERRFAALFGIDARALRNLLRAGFYRFSTGFPVPAVESGASSPARAGRAS